MKVDGPLARTANSTGKHLLNSLAFGVLALVLVNIAAFMPATAQAGQIGNCAAEYTTGQ